MECPKCGGSSKVKKTDTSNDRIKRIRQCLDCKKYFHSIETRNNPVGLKPDQCIVQTAEINELRKTVAQYKALFERIAPHFRELLQLLFNIHIDNF